MHLKELKNSLGIDLYQSLDPSAIPESEEELELHMQLSYKQSIEIAEEEAISAVFAQNKYDLIRRRLNMDLTVCGIAAAKTNFNTAEGITVDYEKVWEKGTGNTTKQKDINVNKEFIKDVVQSQSSDDVVPSVLYGGIIHESNSEDFFTE